MTIHTEGDSTFVRRCCAPAARWTWALLLGSILACGVAGAGPALGAADEAPGDLSVPDLDSYVQAAMESWSAPGLALVVVHDDRVFTRAYGFTSLGGDEPVDENTLFPIGSLTKAFTATLLATLVDQGVIDWDHPVVRHLPELELADPWITRHLTIRDLLSHRTGLAGNDLMWVAGGQSPEELIRRLRFLEPASGFRAGLTYNNAMFLVAGEVAEAVTGEPWHVLARERIFEPLGMTWSIARSEELRSRSNVALPHQELGPGQLLGDLPRAGAPLDAPDRVRRIDWFESGTAPAGAIASTAGDFGRWLRLQLGSGTLDGERLVSEEALLATRTPLVASPGFPRSQTEASETNLAAYAMGWGIRDYRGRWMLLHRGSTPGWGASAAVLPTEGVGVAAFTNLTDFGVADAVTHWIVDRLLNAEAKDWNADALARTEERRRRERAGREKAAARVPGTSPSAPLEAYAGSYASALYPTARVTLRDERLRLVLGPQLQGDLDHWQDDTFRVTWDRADFGANLVTFATGDAGQPESVRVRILGQEAVWTRPRADGPATEGPHSGPSRRSASLARSR